MYNIISEETYPDGAMILEEGSSGDWIYTVLSGKIEIFKMINGRRVVVDMLEEGDVLGETGFLTQMKRTASARAIGDVTVGIIDRDYLDGEFNKLSGDFKTILLALAERLTKTTEAVCAFTDKYRDPRVARDLKIVYKQNGAFVRSSLYNISSRGFFVRTNEPLEKGKEFLFKLEIPGAPDPIKGASKVIWSRTVSDSPGTRPKGMGCRFIKMRREDRMVLKTFLANIQLEEPV